jgi:hypothetical protein
MKILPGNLEKASDHGEFSDLNGNPPFRTVEDVTGGAR